MCVVSSAKKPLKAIKATTAPNRDQKNRSTKRSDSRSEAMDRGTAAVDATSLIAGLRAHGIANVASDAPFTICGRDRPLAPTKPTDPPRLFQSADPAEVRYAINVPARSA